MLRFFLRAKHWQLFLLIFGLPLLVQAVLLRNITSVIVKLNVSPNPDTFTPYIIAVAVATLLSLLGLLAWYWSIATGLRQATPSISDSRVRLFKVTFLFPVLYFSFLAVAVLFGIGDEVNFSVEPQYGPLLYVLPFHLLTMLCLLYCAYFVAKTIKTAEAGHAVPISSFAGDILLIWFFPIGVWFLQPRVNRLAGESLLEGGVMV